MDFPASDVLDYFKQLHKSAREHFGPAADSKDGPLGRGNQQQLLWIQIIFCAPWWPHLRLSDDEAAALDVYLECGLLLSDIQAVDAERAMSICNAISDYLETEVSFSVLKLIDQGGLERARRHLMYSAMGCKKPRTRFLLPGEINLPPGALHILMPYPDKVLPVHTARFVSRSGALRRRLRTTRRTLIRGTCEVSTTSWSAPISP